jgi:hypothetical protein
LVVLKGKAWLASNRDLPPTKPRCLYLSTPTLSVNGSVGRRCSMETTIAVVSEVKVEF